MTTRGRISSQCVFPQYASNLMRSRPSTKSWSARLACVRRTCIYHNRMVNLSSGHFGTW